MHVSDAYVREFRGRNSLKGGRISDSHDRIFGTIFMQSRTVLRFGFAPGTNVFGFCGVFWYHNIR